MPSKCHQLPSPDRRYNGDCWLWTMGGTLYVTAGLLSTGAPVSPTLFLTCGCASAPFFIPAPLLRNIFNNGLTSSLPILLQANLRLPLCCSTGHLQTAHHVQLFILPVILLSLGYHCFRKTFYFLPQPPAHTFAPRHINSLRATNAYLALAASAFYAYTTMAHLP